MNHYTLIFFKVKGCVLDHSREVIEDIEERVQARSNDHHLA